MSTPTPEEIAAAMHVLEQATHTEPVNAGAAPSEPVKTVDEVDPFEVPAAQSQQPDLDAAEAKVDSVAPIAGADSSGTPPTHPYPSSGTPPTHPYPSSDILLGPTHVGV